MPYSNYPQSATNAAKKALGHKEENGGGHDRVTLPAEELEVSLSDFSGFHGTN